MQDFRARLDAEAALAAALVAHPQHRLASDERYHEVFAVAGYPPDQDLPDALVSAISAWTTVAVLQAWTRRSLGPVVALFAAAVLATSFGFLYVHSGRTAETASAGET